MRKLFVIGVALALLLCACGAETVGWIDPPPSALPTPVMASAQTPGSEVEAEAEPSPEPTPEPTPMPTELRLTDESADEILAYAAWTQLEYVDATASREYEALRALQDALPDCRVEWLYDYGGELLNSLETTELKPASTEGLAEALRALPRVKFIDLLDVTVPDAEKDALMEANPGVDFLWWVSFGHWTVRSDIQVFSSLLGGAKWEPRYLSEDLAPLFKYCRHLKALDLGHNNLQDLSLLGTLSELQVLILADNQWLKDISPLANLTELRYLELFADMRIADLSPLRSLTKLEDVNLCHEYMRVEFTVFKDRLSATDGGWRATDENVAIRTAFYNYKAVTSFDYWEDIEYDPEAEVVWLLPTIDR